MEQRENASSELQKKSKEHPKRKRPTNERPSSMATTYVFWLTDTATCNSSEDREHQLSEPGKRAPKGTLQL